VYPASTGHPRLWEHLEGLATSANTAIDAIGDAMEGAWSSYSPAWTSTGTAPALGNGSLTGHYKQVGNTVHLRTTLVLGGTSTIGTGVYRISLPVAAKIGSHLTAVCEDNSASGAKWAGVALITAAITTGDNMRIIVTASSAGVSSVAPFTWASGDSLWLAGSYEAN
jgi:hypothetical protein